MNHAILMPVLLHFLNAEFGAALQAEHGSAHVGIVKVGDAVYPTAAYRTGLTFCTFQPLPAAAPVPPATV